MFRSSCSNVNVFPPGMQTTSTPDSPRCAGSEPVHASTDRRAYGARALPIHSTDDSRAPIVACANGQITIEASAWNASLHRCASCVADPPPPRYTLPTMRRSSQSSTPVATESRCRNGVAASASGNASCVPCRAPPEAIVSGERIVAARRQAPETPPLAVSGDARSSAVIARFSPRRRTAYVEHRAASPRTVLAHRVKPTWSVRDADRGRRPHAHQHRGQRRRRTGAGHRSTGLPLRRGPP